jgi:hypothetical protein
MVWKEDITAYKHFCEGNAAFVPLFYQPEWLEAVVDKGCCRFWVAEKSGEIVALFAGHYRKKYGLHVLLMPQLTPYMGIWSPVMQDDERMRELTTALLQQLPSVFFTSLCLNPGIKDAMPWKWRGYQQQTRFTYLIKASDKRDYRAGIQGKLLNHIKYATERLTIDVNADLRALLPLVKDSFAQQHMALPYPESLLVKIGACKAARARITVALDQNRQAQAALLTVEDGHTVYNLVSGRKKEAVRGAMPLLLNEAIERAMEQGKNFDFEGSSIQRIATFFASFGGKLTPFHHVYRSANRLTDALIAFIGKYKAQ